MPIVHVAGRTQQRLLFFLRGLFFGVGGVVFFWGGVCGEVGFWRGVVFCGELFFGGLFFAGKLWGVFLLGFFCRSYEVILIRLFLWSFFMKFCKGFFIFIFLFFFLQFLIPCQLLEVVLSPLI